MWTEKPLLLGGLKHFSRLLKQHSRQTFALLFTAVLCVTLLFSACTPTNSGNSTAAPTDTPGQGKNTVVRIGYQKSGTLALVKAQGGLEKRLQPNGISVKWTQFPAGPQLLEALNSGSIDLGHTGETPPVFAQAAGVPLVYIGNSPPRPESQGLLVSKDSPVRRVADLRGKKVALQKGSSAHYFLVQALTTVGLQYRDIKSVYLTPADARAALEQGSVDAWAIWDPYYAVAQRSIAARLIVDGKGIVSHREFYLTSQSFAKQHPDLIKAVLDEVQTVSNWATSHRKQVAEILSPQLGIDVPTLETAEQRNHYGVQPLQASVIAEQQQVADIFFNLRLIPKQIKVKDVAQAS